MPLYKNPDFRSLPAALVSVFDRRGDNGFFSLPQWYHLLTRLGFPEGTDVHVYTDVEECPSIALLCANNFAEGRSLTSLANFYSVEHGLLHCPAANLDDALAAILSDIAATRPRWECLRLTDFDPDEPAYAALVRRLRHAGYLVECTPGAATWFENTAGMKFADYFAQRPSALRNTWRRKRRAAIISGRLTAKFTSDPSEIETGIDDYQKIYASSWKKVEAFPNFVPALMRLAAELRALRLGIYYVDGIPAAAQFWIIWHGRAIIYKLAHDERFDNLSLGTLLTMEMVERVLEQDRPTEINFGRGDDPYKRLWLSRRRARWGITAANPRTVHGLRLGLEREAAKLYHRFRGEPLAPYSD